MGQNENTKHINTESAYFHVACLCHLGVDVVLFTLSADIKYVGRVENETLFWSPPAGTSLMPWQEMNKWCI